MTAALLQACATTTRQDLYAASREKRGSGTRKTFPVVTACAKRRFAQLSSVARPFDSAECSL